MPKRSLIFHSHRCGGGCGKQSYSCQSEDCRYSDWAICSDCAEKNRLEFLRQVEEDKAVFNLCGKSFSYSRYKDQTSGTTLSELSEKTKINLEFFEDLSECDERKIEPLPSDVNKIAQALELPLENFYQQSRLF